MSASAIFKAQPVSRNSRTGWAFVMFWIVLMTAAVTWPFFAPIGRGETHPQLLLRDMVIVPHPPLTDATLGLSPSAARNIPQDTVLWALGYLANATYAAASLIVLSALLGGLASAELARTLGQAGRVGQCAAVTMALWNPFVVERLLQGQWSLVIGAWMLPAIVLATTMSRPWWRASALAFAAITPTGAILGGITGVVAARSIRDRSLVCLTTIVASLPWLVATFLQSANRIGGVGGMTADPAGAAAFAARAENHVGTLGALLALGGIWNRQAVPGARESGLAAIAVIGLLALLGLGAYCLFFSRLAPELAHRDVAKRMIIAALAVVALVAFLASTPGLGMMAWLLEHVPGWGLFRDTQKWVALALPAYVILAAAGAQGVVKLISVALSQLHEAREPSAALEHEVASVHDAAPEHETSFRTRLGVRVAAGIISVVAIMSAVPGLPADLKPLRPTAMWDGWTPVSGVVAMSDLSVVVMPAGSYRVIDGIPAFDPAQKILPANVVNSGELIVSGSAVSGEGDGSVERAIVDLNEKMGAGNAAGKGDAASKGNAAGAGTIDTDPAAVDEVIQLIRDRGIGWVLVEHSPGPTAPGVLLNRLERVYQDANLGLYRVPGNVAETPKPTKLMRATAWLAFALWVLVLLTGPIGGAMQNININGSQRVRR